MQMGFYFDQTRCTGCRACQVACKDWHDVPAGPENWMRVLYTEKGSFPDVFVSYMVSPCWHCISPVCAEACPVEAINKRPADGVVTVDPETCLGKDECGAKCLKACPYDAPQFGPEQNARMHKCNFCLDRLEQGKVPNCVEACYTRALDAGPIEELREKYGSGQEAEGFSYSKRTKPAVVIKAKTA
ncbi:MAG: 4Fe-4S dicluster domain-containing protein [Desulfobacteraceae bacterium]|nr:4Fe-4S dicluster domain-containing protein [Desulfobacteraceae bacterium]